MGLGKRRSLDLEFGFYSESNQNALENFMQSGREQEDQFGVVLVRKDVSTIVPLNLELPDETNKVCLFVDSYFGSERDLHFM